MAGLCRGEYYDDPVSMGQESLEKFGRDTTPYLEDAVPYRRAIHRLHDVRAYPQDSYTHHEQDHEEVYEPEDLTAGFWDDQVPADPSDNEPGKGLFGGLKHTLKKAAGVVVEVWDAGVVRPLKPLPATFEELDGTVLRTESGHIFIATSDPELTEMAVNEPSNELEGTSVMTSDGYVLTLVSPETLAAANRGTVPQNIVVVLEEMEEMEASRNPNDPGSVLNKMGEMTSGGNRPFTADLFDHTFDGDIQLLFSGVKFSRRRGLKKGRRTSGKANKTARREARAERKNLKKRRAERRKVQKQRRQLAAEKKAYMKRQREIQNLKRKQEQETLKLSREAQLLKEEEAAFEQMVGQAGQGEGPPLPPRDTYYNTTNEGEDALYSKHKGRMGGMYYHSMSEMPGTVIMTGQGFVSEGMPKDSVALSKVFHKKLLGFTDEAYEEAQSQAMSFFKTKFGIPVEKARLCKDGTYKMGSNFTISPYGVRSSFKTTTTTVDDVVDDSADTLIDSTVHEGGWKLAINSKKGCLIKGEYGGSSGKKVGQDAVMKWGHWNIQRGNGLKPVNIHFESSEPFETGSSLDSALQEKFDIDYVDSSLHRISEEDIQMGDAIRITKLTPQFDGKRQNLNINTKTYLQFE